MVQQSKRDTQSTRRANELGVTYLASSTRGVPGVLLRSIYSHASGTRAGGTPAFITGQ
jgi:hypothetical protein